MPSSNFPNDVKDVIHFFARNPLNNLKVEYVWTYERTGMACKVIPICPTGKICDQKIKLVRCDPAHISICLNFPKE